MVSKLRGHPQNGRKSLLAIYTADKVLIIRIDRELKKLNSPKINEPIKKLFGQWAATPWRSGTLCSLSALSPPSLHDYHGNSCWQAMGPDLSYRSILPQAPPHQTSTYPNAP
jgi:hypothetical protein